MKPAEAFILKQSEPFRAILLHLQLLIESTCPTAILKYKWKLPVYYIDNKPLCYLNVSLKKGHVDVGFWASSQLKDNEHLVTDGRKVVKSLRYKKLNDVNEDVLFSILEEIKSFENKGFWTAKK